MEFYELNAAHFTKIQLRKARMVKVGLNDEFRFLIKGT